MSQGRQPPREEGFTLIELMVAAGIMALIAIMVSTTLIGGIHTAARGEKRTDDVTAAQQAMLRITRDLRAASDVTAASSDRIVVLTHSAGASDSAPGDPPEQVTYERVAPGSPVDAPGRLVMTRQATTSVGGVFTPTGTAMSTTLVANVLSTVKAGHALFTMLSKADGQKQCQVGPTVSTLPSPLSTANLDKVYAFDIFLTVNSAPSLSARPVTIPGGAVIASLGELRLDAANLPAAGVGLGCS